jgi:type II secretory pathway pseudopilin PulG
MSSRRQRRHRAQAGTTLIELLVSVTIIGLVVVVLVGAFSTAVVDATVAKRTTAVNAAHEYELEKIAASAFSGTPSPYSECFAVDVAAAPTQVVLGGSCPAGTDVRADVTESGVPGQTGLQQWDVNTVSYPSLAPIGSTISVYKANR